MVLGKKKMLWQNGQKHVTESGFQLQHGAWPSWESLKFPEIDFRMFQVQATQTPRDCKDSAILANVSTC